jgi:hypothetical protein
LRSAKLDAGDLDSAFTDLLIVREAMDQQRVIGKALSIQDRFEVPVAAWWVHATAAEVATRDPNLARAE